MTEIPGNFAFRDDATLESIEDGMRAVVADQKLYMAILAISLGRIQRERLFLRVEPSFKVYIRKERTGLPYSQAHKLATAGNRYWEFREAFKENGIPFQDHISKAGLIDPAVAHSDPMFWEKFRGLSVGGLIKYNRRQNGNINVYTATAPGSVIVKGSTLSIDGQKVRGLNLNEARRQIRMGRRLVPIWVNDDAEARRIRRAIGNVGAL